MKTITLAAIAVSAGFAHADLFSSQDAMNPSTATPNGAAQSNILTIDVSGMQFNDISGSALNQTLSVFIGQGQLVRGIAWDVNLTTIGASWASEAIMGFEGQIILTAGTDDNPVSNMNYNSGGFLYLQDEGVPDITVGADGILDIEFYESFVDNAGTGDSYFEPGSTITITNLPTPGALAMFGFSGLALARRRR